MKIKERTFMIEDVDCVSIVEVVSKQKDVFDWLEDYIENMQYEWFDPCDDSFAILYKDGTTDYIDESYDGHKIRRRGIASMVYNNTCTSIVYGPFAINAYGVVTVSEKEEIADENIRELKAA